MIFLVFLACFYLAAGGSDLVLSPAATDNALSVTVNPAGLGTYRGANLGLVSGLRPDSLFYAGLSIKGIGFGVRSDGASRSFYLADGIRIKGGLYAGMRTGYVDTDLEDYYNYDLGLMARPFNFLSLGACTDNLVHGGTAPTLVRLGAGLRPLDFMTVSGDIDYGAEGFMERRVGVEFQLEGLNIAASADLRGGRYLAGISMSLPNFEAGGMFPAGKSETAARITLWTGADRRPSVAPMPKQVAVIEVSGEFIDIHPEFSLLGNAWSQPLGRVLTQIRNAANDEDIGTVILKIGSLQSGLGAVEEIRNAVLDLRISGKRVICYMDGVELLEYYLACACDEIVVEPAGAWMMAGVRAEIMFFKGTLDKLGIKAEFERVGEYKSAVEPLTRDSISAPFKENEEALLKSLYDYFVDGIVSGRDLERDTVAAVIERGGLSLKEAVDRRFITRTGYFNGLVSEFSPVREKGVNLDKRTYYNTSWRRKKGVAVVMATGVIVPGESFTDFLSGEIFMGSETISRILRDVRKDPAIRAVVLRINSGGGSAVASDIMWREVEELKKAGKPVIVSIGDVAASGGYYMACNADTIVCNPGSIVGSIGVFTGKFVLKGLYDKIGVTKEIIKFGRNADAFSDYHGFTDEQRGLIQISLNEFYDGFVAKVAEGRKISKEKADSLGRGRVFTGTQAKENGLVDVIGDLADAIDIAKEKAGFTDSENPEIEVFPKRKTFFSSMMEDNEEAKLAATRSFFRAVDMLNSQKLLAIMPYRITVK